MITRIVKMEIKPEAIDTFMDIFSHHAINMESVAGCMTLQLLQNDPEATIFFTISTWQRQEDLENYRQSELFSVVWSKVKPLFCARPQAWTTQSIYHGKN
ncbi:MAG: antibiotic biosynthesis monooxygenase [Saprospiraceae bacterium]|nr:antibiotic biosynthesis monooxygenase [Saprospiraceae bacterium]MBK6480996.1 antibiotic biosynthesis monooxygenase [Saprospiraceae bacterium]MBK6815603.1 antibiotic biosynthesis monooxygenase [Saprospiraceae bacterium]MBK7439268.1 antibiotic biosynthesis monooxygenase [Saprospiraceae bacterium]MBK7605708.1 antibiotic biosynthesis monooxygenase [Saprospiraceae bacterium]